MQKFDSHESAVALSKYLGSRFHPELPHIGTVGTADVEESVEKDYQEEDDELVEKDELKKNEEHEKKVTKDETMTHDLSVISRSAERQFSSFKFVPHTASYGMKLAGQNKNLVTNIFILHKDQ